MSLIKREPTPAQLAANRANSLHSTGPRSETGKAVSSRNALKPRGHSPVRELSLQELGEDPAEFEQRFNALSEAMRPRDGWEAAWVQDIAMLRWRLERLQRAEAGTLAVHRRRFRTQRRREAVPPTGVAGLELNNLVSLVGFTGIPDSAMKFQQVIEFLKQLRDVVEAERFEDEAASFFAMIYGKTPGPQGTILKARFETLAKASKVGHSEAIDEGRKSLLADLNKEIESYEQLQAAYLAEHVKEDPLQQDAELLLPGDDLDLIIRYETHLENQIERKLRQFYARRRESSFPQAETPPTIADNAEGSELTQQTAGDA
jgi:hypothetical protein